MLNRSTIKQVSPSRARRQRAAKVQNFFLGSIMVTVLVSLVFLFQAAMQLYYYNSLSFWGL